MEDVPAWLDNAALVSWGWHYSNATGGVKVLVPLEYFDRARVAISPPAGPAQPPDAWACPRCHAEVDGRWDRCWSCGSTAGGEEDPHFHDECQPAQVTSPEMAGLASYGRSRFAATIIAFVFILVLMFSHGSPAAVLGLFGCFVLGALFRWLWDHASLAASTAEEEGAESEPEPCDHSEPTVPENYDLAEELVWRMWTASMFGMVYWTLLFTPWAIWLAFRLTTLGVELRPREHFRWRCSLVCIVISGLMSSWWLWLIGRSFLGRPICWSGASCRLLEAG